MAATPRPIEQLSVTDPADPHALFAAGVDLLRRNPAAAADAFYWAARRDPTWADPLYARRLALLMAEPRMFELYLADNRSILQSPGIARLDSLYLRALELNPFLQPKLDVVAYRHVLTSSIEQSLRQQGMGNVSTGEIETYIDQSLRRSTPATRAWIAFSEGRYQDAVRLYREALRSRDRPYTRANLARALFYSGDRMASQTEFGATLEALRERDQKDVVRVYESKAMYEHAIGLIAESLEDAAEARDAYARALQEDLSYHAAHVQLGILALSLGDTTTALAELALAAEIAPDDPRTRYEYGRMLIHNGQHADAERELRAAIAAEPLFAPPYAALGDVLAEAGRSDDARVAYTDFLTHSRRNSPERVRVEGRLRSLGDRKAGM